jgi:hypothetical protein
MMQALYDAILVDERVLEDAFKYEVLARQAEVSDDQALIEFSARCVMRIAAVPRGLSGSWPSCCPRSRYYADKEERLDATESQERCPR